MYYNRKRVKKMEINESEEPELKESEKSIGKKKDENYIPPLSRFTRYNEGYLYKIGESIGILANGLVLSY